jgi:hypothetical protein
MKSENVTKEDIKDLDLKLSKGFKILDTKIDLINTNLSKDIKNLDNKIDKLENNMNDMFEKFTTVILEAIDGKSEKTVKESHENTLRIVEVERDRYSVLFEMNSDHEAKIKSLDKRVLTLEHA